MPKKANKSADRAKLIFKESPYFYTLTSGNRTRYWNKKISEYGGKSVAIDGDQEQP